MRRFHLQAWWSEWRHPSAGPRPPLRLGRFIIAYIGLLLLAFIGVQLVIAAQVINLRHHHPDSSAFMREQLAQLHIKHPQAHLRFRWREFAAISPYIKQAVISAEDTTFMSNDGFDWRGIRDALEKNLEAGEFVAGGSTLTQQLAKNLFLSGRRTLVRKGEEAIITVLLTTILSKQRILTLYLNYAQWGRHVFGIEAAARHYYGVSAAQLNRWQAARLAAMLPNPEFYDRVGNTAWLLKKTGIITRRMPRVAYPH